MSPYYAIVIGAGSAGLTVAVGLSKLGKKVLIVEKHKVGGDCTNVGCIPSKTLIHLSQSSTIQGGTEILAEVRRRRDHLEHEETEWLQGLPHLEVVFGQARFSGRGELEIVALDGSVRHVRSERIVIATGARPRRPAFAEFDDQRYLTNTNLFDLESPPLHLGIVGAGIIGSEMAFAFRRLGCRVSLVGPILSAHEPEVSQVIESSLRAAGIETHSRARAVGYEPEGQTLRLETPDGQRIIVSEVDRVLLAVGRQPNLELNLPAAGVSYDEKGIQTDKVGKAAPGVYAIGDVVAGSTTTHSANHQGRRLIRHLVAPFLPLGGEPHYPSTVFCEPEVAQVGPTLERLRATMASELIKSVRFDLKDTDRGYTSYLEEGFVLLHAVRLTGTLLSATIVAPRAGEMIPLLTLALKRRTSLYQLADLVFSYPTLSEAIKKASDAFVFATLADPLGECRAYLSHRWKSPA